MHQQSILLLADAGIPMIFLTFPAMVALLVPIILLEAWLCKKWLSINTWTALKSNAVANVASTLMGVPAAWVLMLCVELVSVFTVAQITPLNRLAHQWHSPLATALTTLLSAAWLPPDEMRLYWMVPVAALGLLIPTFFISVWIEGLVMEQMLRMSEGNPSNLTRFRIRQVVRNINLASYSVLALGTIGWLFVSLLKRSH